MKENYKLEKCTCGGDVELIPSTPYAQDPKIHCKKCNGNWKYDTYSDALTVEKWNKEHNKECHNIFSDLHPKEIPTKKT